MLVRRKFGQLTFERPSVAPSYHFKERDFLQPERFAWYLPNRDVERFETDRRALGNMPASYWVIGALNSWIGRPGGLGEKELALEMRAQEGSLYPTADAQGEPYWAIVAVDTDGHATGGMWSPKEKHVILFARRSDAEKMSLAAGAVPPYTGPYGKTAVAWSVRGVSGTHLTALKRIHDLTLVRAELTPEGHLVATSIP